MAQRRNRKYGGYDLLYEQTKPPHEQRENHLRWFRRKEESRYHTRASGGPQKGLASMSEIMLTSKCVAKMINVHPDTLRNWRKAGKGPRYLKEAPNNPQSIVRYPEKWVQQWQQERMV